MERMLPRQVKEQLYGGGGYPYGSPIFRIPERGMPGYLPRPTGWRSPSVPNLVPLPQVRTPGQAQLLGQAQTVPTPTPPPALAPVASTVAGTAPTAALAPTAAAAPTASTVALPGESTLQTILRLRQAGDYAGLARHLTETGLPVPPQLQQLLSLTAAPTGPAPLTDIIPGSQGILNTPPVGYQPGQQYLPLENRAQFAYNLGSQMGLQENTGPLANAARLLANSLAGNPFISPEGLANLQRGLLPNMNALSPAFFQNTSPTIADALQGLYRSGGIRTPDLMFALQQMAPESFLGI